MSLRVTIVVPGRWHAFDLARELHALGVLHRIVTTYPRSRTRRWGIPDERVVSLPLQLILTKLVWKCGGEKAAMRWQFRINDVFARRAARFVDGAEVVHAWSGSAEPSLRRASVLGIATALERSSSHMSTQCRLLREEYASLGLKWQETPRATVERELREYALAECVFVPSRFVWRSFVSEGVPESKLRLNGFGVDRRAFAPGGKNDDVFRVVYAGSLSVRKGIQHLIAAFRQADLPVSELVLVGGATPETDRLVGAPDARIVRVGHVPQAELVKHYRRSDVFVMASVEEGQACVQAQALAAGLPLICSAHTGGEDFLVRGGAPVAVPGFDVAEYPAGYVVPARDPASIAECLRRLHASPSLLVAKRAAAVALGANDLSWGAYGTRAVKHYEELVRTYRDR